MWTTKCKSKEDSGRKSEMRKLPHIFYIRKAIRIIYKGEKKMV